MSIRLEQLIKRYEGHAVVNQVSLEIGDGEFFVLLGPSGSGKSTVLRIIAGLTEAETGRVLLHGRDVTGLPAQARGIGFVFQSYALFRHMTVGENIEFPLRVRRVRAAERARRRDEMLEMVGLAGLGRRLPQQLSGGQQQRVALARALAHKPELLLLDEPFGALDARIRAELRRTVRGIQRETGVTTLFVTHDQEEAFELADRIGVMNYGRLLEDGPPRELYLRPQTEFVATFLGTANLMVGECGQEGVRLGPVRVPLATGVGAGGDTPRRVQVLFRPEDVAVKTTPDALEWPLLGQAVVEESGFLGSFERLRLRMPRLAGVRPIAPPAPFGGEEVILEASRSQHQARRYPLRVGDKAWVGVRRFHALTHPGLSILLLTDGHPDTRHALELGAQIGRMAHARVSLLGYGLEGDFVGSRLQEAREWAGTGLQGFDARPSPDPMSEAVADEAARRHIDLVVHAMPHRGRLDLAERLLQAGDHNVLLVPAGETAPVVRGAAGASSSAAGRSGPVAAPARVLICVAVGEPAKEDVLFAGRLVRHLGAEVTIMTVLGATHGDLEVRQAERFLAAGRRTLTLLGITSQAAIRRGHVRDEVRAQMNEGGHDLLVVGAPLPAGRGRVTLVGIIGALIEDVQDRPVLIVRPHAEESWRT
jgi:sulfate transport system ATP-binding protein